jgi:YHS domain-containing protein
MKKGMIGGIGAALLLGSVGAARAHDVKDPVCRMMTDTDTTPYRETVNGKTYYFCSDTCKAKFDKAPTEYVTLNAQLAAGLVRTYQLDFAAPPHPLPNRPVPLSFTVRERPSDRVVQDFEVVHEKRLHFLIVSADLAYFEHQHPTLGPDGRFRLTWTFPRAGRYYLFADCTPTDGDNQILRTALDIGGSRTQPLASPHLVADTGQTKTVGDTRVRLTLRPGSIRAGRQALLTYTLTDNAGSARTDLQPILGVMGHLIALRDDTQTIVHTHALHGVQAGSYGAAMLTMMQAGQPEAVPVTPEMVTETGPAFTFKLTLPKPGLYKLWAQFQRRNRWLTVSFTVRVR